MSQRPCRDPESYNLKHDSCSYIKEKYKMDNVKEIVTKVLDFLHVADGLPFHLGEVVHTLVVGVPAVVVVKYLGLPLTPLTTVAIVGAARVVEGLLYDWVNS